MFDTEDESAEFKQRLKHDPVSDSLRSLAEIHGIEAQESIAEVEDGLDTFTPGSWVAEMISRPLHD